jgi:DNA processing protein
MSVVKYWIWLASLPGLSRRAVPSLLDYFESPREAYFAAFGEYDHVPDLTAKDRQMLADKGLKRVEEIQKACAERDIRVMTMQDADYPQRLVHIYDPPPVLYIRGRVPVIDEEAAIAVVGTRSASAYGVKMAARMGYELTRGGGLVVSGLAVGVDTAAAKGALSAGGACVGVLGSAIDTAYPRCNAGLIEDVAAAGALLSEYPPGYPTRPENFPRRNRLLSGLSVGVVVIEAPKHSGALITANLALEQGRELFVVPGNADAPGCEGSNELLKDCAKAVSCGGDVLCEFERLFPWALAASADEARLPLRGEERILRETLQQEESGPGQATSGSGEKKEKESVETASNRPDATKKVIDKRKPGEYIDGEDLLEGLTEVQQRLVRVMDRPNMHTDDLIEKTGLPAAQVLSELTMLSIKGLVSPAAGKRFTLNTKKRGQ